MTPIVIVTWYDPDTGDTYISNQQKKASDYAIKDMPMDLDNTYKYNPKTSEWEVVYDLPSDDDLDLGDVERLWELSVQTEDTEKQLLARLVLKLCNL